LVHCTILPSFMVEDSAGIAKSLCDTMLTRSVGMRRAATGAAAQPLAATGRCETAAAPGVRSEGRNPTPGAKAALDAIMTAAMRGVMSFILPKMPKIWNGGTEEEEIPGEPGQRNEGSPFLNVLKPSKAAHIEAGGWPFPKAEHSFSNVWAGGDGEFTSSI